MNRKKDTKLKPFKRPQQAPLRWIKATTEWNPVHDMTKLLRINHGFAPLKAWYYARFCAYFRKEHGGGDPHHTFKFYVKVDDGMAFVTRFDVLTKMPWHETRNDKGNERQAQRIALAYMKKHARWQAAADAEGKVIQLKPEADV